MAVTEQEFKAAEEQSAQLRQAGHAISARYDSRARRVVVELDSGVQIAFPARLAEGLGDASAADLSEIEISPTGLGLHWPRLDADLYVPGLMQGLFGSRAWMAAEMGAAGGRVSSAAKAAAARKNGAKGGRPRRSMAG
jgi:hypothetical protein